MPRNYAALPYEYKREMAALSDEEFGRLCRFLIEYSESGTPIAPTGNERFYAERVMMQEDRFKASYDGIATSRSESGRRGARARWKRDSEVPPDAEGDGKRWQSMANDSKAWQTMANDSKLWQGHGKNGNTETDTETNTEVITGDKPPIVPLLSDFDRFWSVYPRKIGKQAALKAWSRLSPSAELTQAIFAAVEYQRGCRQWTEEGGKYIPNASKWLNEARWEDEPDAINSAGRAAKSARKTGDFLLNSIMNDLEGLYDKAGGEGLHLPDGQAVAELPGSGK